MLPTWRHHFPDHLVRLRAMDKQCYADMKQGEDGPGRMALHDLYLYLTQNFSRLAWSFREPTERFQDAIEN